MKLRHEREWTMLHWTGPLTMQSVGACPRCGSSRTWRVGKALGGSPNTCACHACNRYFQLAVAS